MASCHLASVEWQLAIAARTGGGALASALMLAPVVGRWQVILMLLGEPFFGKAKTEIQGPRSEVRDLKSKWEKYSVRRKRSGDINEFQRSNGIKSLINANTIMIYHENTNMKYNERPWETMKKY